VSLPQWPDEDMTRFIPFLIIITAYGFGCWGSSVVMWSTGNHMYFDAQVALGYLHYPAQSFVDIYGLPDPDELNHLIEARWGKDSNATNYEEPQTEMEADLDFIADCANEHALRVWKTPPRFVQSKAIPGGFGFYLDGEDGISISRGEDRDDINSWSRGSIRFYQTRMRNHRLLRDSIVGFCFATVAGLMVFGLNKKRKFNKPSRRMTDNPHNRQSNFNQPPVIGGH
jgi:hypothetical protein